MATKSSKPTPDNEKAAPMMYEVLRPPTHGEYEAAAEKDREAEPQRVEITTTEQET